MAAEARRSSIDVKVGLFVGEGTPSYIRMDNVSDIPDLQATPEQLEVTAIGDIARKYINGLLETDELEFTCFYEKKAFEDVKDGGAGAIAVQIGKRGKDGVTEEITAIIKGQLSASISGFGVGDVINYTLRVAVEEFAWAEEAVTIAEPSAE